MESTPNPHFLGLHQFPTRLPPPPSSPPITNLLRRHQNVQYKFNCTMPLSNLALRFITANPYQFRFNHRHSKPSFLNNNIISIPHKTMADESNKLDIQPEKIEDKEKELQNSTPEIPPPPEKPLPGDCCGSGCVTCVWDLYYEELEEYNRLYKESSNKPS